VLGGKSLGFRLVISAGLWSWLGGGDASRAFRKGCKRCSVKSSIRVRNFAPWLWHLLQARGGNFSTVSLRISAIPVFRDSGNTDQCAVRKRSQPYLSLFRCANSTGGIPEKWRTGTLIIIPADVRGFALSFLLILRTSR